jgi:hypothetical protein
MFKKITFRIEFTLSDETFTEFPKKAEAGFSVLLPMQGNVEIMAGEEVNIDMGVRFGLPKDAAGIVAVDGSLAAELQLDLLSFELGK